jgi:hypothetical protein
MVLMDVGGRSGRREVKGVLPTPRRHAAQSTLYHAAITSQRAQSRAKAPCCSVARRHLHPRARERAPRSAWGPGMVVGREVGRLESSNNVRRWAGCRWSAQVTTPITRPSANQHWPRPRTHHPADQTLSLVDHFRVVHLVQVVVPMNDFESDFPTRRPLRSLDSMDGGPSVARGPPATPNM